MAGRGHAGDFYGAGNILFLDLGVAYTGVLTWRTFVQLLTYDLRGLLSVG